jgi:hypothetical protein
MASPKTDLAKLGSRLADKAGTSRKPDPAEEKIAPARKPKDRGVPITFHMPDHVRHQLKGLAHERRTTIHNLGAEAFNDLFAKYGKPEIAPVTRKGRDQI